MQMPWILSLYQCPTVYIVTPIPHVIFLIPRFSLMRPT